MCEQNDKLYAIPKLTQSSGVSGASARLHSSRLKASESRLGVFEMFHVRSVVLQGFCSLFSAPSEIRLSQSAKPANRRSPGDRRVSGEVFSNFSGSISSHARCVKCPWSTGLPASAGVDSGWMYRGESGRVVIAVGQFRENDEERWIISALRKG